MPNSLAVIGAGGISRFHFLAFEQTHTPVRVVSDIDEAKARPYVDKFGAVWERDYRAAVARRDVNAVIVLTPSSLHYEVCKAALDAGKHVVCEKTLTLSPQQSLELGRLAEKKGLVFFTSYMKRFFPAVQKAKELMPRLGHIMSVYCRTYQGLGGANAHTGEVPAGFRPGPDGVIPIVRLAGGGVLICGGSHICDLLLFLVGKPERVQGRMFTRPGITDIDLMTHAMFDLPGGGVAHFEANWHPLRRIGYEKRGWDEGFEISGVNGRIILKTPVWDQPEHNAPVLEYYDNETGAWTSFTFDVVNPFVEAEKHFLAQIEKGEQGTRQDRFTGYRADLLLEMIKQSAQKDRTLKIEWEA